MPPSSRSTPTIHDVADRAGVSPATVSRVVNDTGQTADATRERVLKAVEELRYRPNRTAKSLSQGVTQTIAVAVPTFTTPFHNELLKGVRSRLKTVDTDLLLCDLEWAAPEASLTQFLERGAMDGLLAAGLPMSESVAREVKKLGGPTILIGNRWDDIDSFHWDETKGAWMATEHLIDRGHSRIGMITTHRENPIRNARIRGYQEALKSAGIQPNNDWIAVGTTEKHAGFSEESGFEAMEALLEQSPGIRAVFASSDVQAIGAWQALRERGISVPDDVALVGYDDIKISQFIGLSSVAQNMHDIGEQATDLLLRRLRGAGPPEVFSKLITPELRVRASSAGSLENGSH
jgi:LacI family transcriptional regulator